MCKIIRNIENLLVKEGTMSKGGERKGTEAQGERARTEKHTVEHRTTAGLLAAAEPISVRNVRLDLTNL